MRIFWLALALILLMALTPACAATSTATITLSSGGLTITTQSGSVDFGTIALTGDVVTDADVTTTLRWPAVFL
ncbi:MAG: hypothetical protein FJX76_24865 [Armatimonadetes bacterium]|nr:hypothetical protein [Armatimonadota bacterium]